MAQAAVDVIEDSALVTAKDGHLTSNLLVVLTRNLFLTKNLSDFKSKVKLDRRLCSTVLNFDPK